MTGYDLAKDDQLDASGNDTRLSISKTGTYDAL